MGCFTSLLDLAEAEKTFGSKEDEPSRRDVDAMTYTLSVLKVGNGEIAQSKKLRVCSRKRSGRLLNVEIRGVTQCRDQGGCSM